MRIDTEQSRYYRISDAQCSPRVLIETCFVLISTIFIIIHTYVSVTELSGCSPYISSSSSTAYIFIQTYGYSPIFGTDHPWFFFFFLWGLSETASSITYLQAFIYRWITLALIGMSLSVINQLWIIARLEVNTTIKLSPKSGVYSIWVA